MSSEAPVIVFLLRVLLHVLGDQAFCLCMLEGARVANGNEQNRASRYEKGQEEEYPTWPPRLL
jgi:hypothetical protein